MNYLQGLLKLFRKKEPCQHPRIRVRRTWVNDTPSAVSDCPDCGFFDEGPVMTMDSKEDWLGRAQ